MTRCSWLAALHVAVQVRFVDSCFRLRMTSIRDGLLLHEFPYESELSEVVAYLRGHDFSFLEDLIGAPCLGTDTHMFMISTAAFDFVNGLVRKLTCDSHKDGSAKSLVDSTPNTEQVIASVVVEPIPRVLVVRRVGMTVLSEFYEMQLRRPRRLWWIPRASARNKL